MFKCYFILIMLLSTTSASASWLDAMPQYESQVKINFMPLLGNEQSLVVNAGKKDSQSKHYIAGVILQKENPAALTMLVVNVKDSLSHLTFQLNNIPVKAVCKRLNLNRDNEIAGYKTSTGTKAELYYPQTGFVRPWFTFFKAQSNARLLEEEALGSSLSACQIPSQFL